MMPGGCRERLARLRERFLADCGLSPIPAIKVITRELMEPVLGPPDKVEGEHDASTRNNGRIIGKERVCRELASKFLGVDNECFEDNVLEDPAKCEECVQQLGVAVANIVKGLAATVAGAVGFSLLLYLLPCLCGEGGHGAEG